MRRAIILGAAMFAACSSTATTPDAGTADASALDAAAPADAARADAEVEPDAATALDAAPSPDAEPSPGFEVVYVGSGDDHVYRYVLDRDTGTLDPRGRTAAGTNPSFLAVDPAGRHLYAVNEGGMNGQVAAFEIDPASGDLTFLNRVSSGGRGPAHLSVDPGGRFVLVANYGDGAIAVLPIEAGGSLGAAVATDNPGRNAHMIITDPAGRFVFVPCLGANLVAQYAFDGTTGALIASAPPSVASTPGAGPRHIAFHPTAPFAYVINELASTITWYAYDDGAGQLTALDSISTLPAGFGGGNSTAEVAVHPNGRFVYGSNRGHNSIAVFAAGAGDGALQFVAHTPTGGSTPRSFALTADGELLLAANQTSNDLHAFRVDAATGTLQPLGSVATPPAPAFVGVFRLRD